MWILCEVSSKQIEDYYIIKEGGFSSNFTARLVWMASSLSNASSE